MSYVDAQRNREFRQVAEGWYRLTLLREGVLLEAKRLRWERGELLGLLVVQCDIAGIKHVDGTVSVGTFNLTSVSARSARAKEIHGQVNAPEIDWRMLLEELCQRTIQAEERGQPIVLLKNVTPKSRDDQTIRIFGLPLAVPHPSIFYGAGGTGKTTIAAALAGELERLGISTLVLDWETNEDDYHATMRALFGDDLPDVKYRRCERALTIEAESIANQIDECGIRYVVCDSAGYAADGRPEDAEVALRFNRALRSLRVGSLTLAHISSGEHGSERPFGSVFWHNSARQTWYLERTPGTSSDAFTVAAFNKKNNLGKLHAAVGLMLSFDSQRTTITPTSIVDEEQFAGRIPLWQRMAYLLQHKPLTIAELATQLEAKPDSVKKALTRGRSFTSIPSVDGVIRWALVERRAANA